MESKTMKKLTQLITLVFISTIAIGCANTKQIEADIATLQSQMQDVSAEASEANERSRAAEASANRAEQTAEDANSKLDRMFKKSMMK
jgi:murein lipoprotein